MREISYNTLALVLDSWEQIRRMKNFEEEAGVILYQRLFNLHPEVRALFGLSSLEINSDNLKTSKRFRTQAKYMIQMLDTSLNMLGPDIELLTEINHDLGKRHVRYGVKPEMYEFMGEALVYTLEKLLGDDFKPEVREAWNQIYIELSDDIKSAYPVN
mmetsp:Transcript_5730/g.11149  ORF Transcript_5730/g.11149 Transcript_5730/m.11149 type:complete len:158 (+) Transcript_5730:56-529(+)